MKTAGRRIVIGLFAAFGLAFTAQGQDASEGAEERVALLIGNANYEYSTLANPINDIELLSERLSALGFDVTTVEDGNERAMERAIVNFAVALQDAGDDAVGLFYYSGHGVQLSGENYLVPIDASIAREADLGAEAIRADWILEQLESAGNRVNFIILDACRNNPLARSFSRSSGSGLAEMRAPVGTFIGYATAPGTVASDGRGSNSPYAAALANEIGEPEVAAEIVFRRVRQRVIDETDGAQIPWDASSLTGDDFYFSVADNPASEETVASASTATNPENEGVARVLTPSGEEAVTMLVGGDRIELAFWESITESDDPADFNAYLERYPEGAFAPLARNRLSALRPSAPAATPPVETTPVTADVIVDGSGRGDYTTIQAAVEAATAGQTILVRAGTYTEDVTFDEEIQVTIRGEGAGANRPRIRAAVYRPIYVTAGQPTIENFILEGQIAEYAAIWVPGGRARIINNEIRSDHNSCIYVQGEAAPTVQGNNFAYCAFHAFYVGENASGIYQDNEIGSTGATAVYLEGQTTASVLRNRITPGADSRAIEVFGGARPYVQENQISGALRGIVVGGVAAGRYERNTISNTGDQSFLAYENSQPNVLDNTFSDTTSHCLHIRDNARGRYERNSLNRCGSPQPDNMYLAPLTITEEATPTVVDNVIRQPGYAQIDNRAPTVDVSSNTIER